MSRRIFDAVITPSPDAEHELPAPVARNAPGNALRLISASALQNIGDQIVKPSTVLPWLFHILGVPAAFTGLLVPIRESGSMLPQAMLTPAVLRVRRRKWVFVTGALVQAAMVFMMALIAALVSGAAAGVLILLALAVFALGRSLCSISSKDVQGRTVAKGQRGQINGLSMAAAGIVAITLGLALRAISGGDIAIAQLVWLLTGGATMWLLAALVYSRVSEPAPADESRPDESRENEQDADEDEEQASPSGWFAKSVTLLRDDAPFRRFVIVRSLLLVSALSPPFVVTLAVSSGAGALSGLGGFVVASGLSALVGGPLFGRIADRSSRTLMTVGAGLASAVLIALVVLTGLPGFDGNTGWGVAVFVGTYFVLTLVHTGVRVGRKTYVVDMAQGDKRTQYVAVSNSAMGVILLAAGGVSSAISVWGVNWALLFLAGLGLLGVVTGARLPEVSAHR